MSEILRQVDEDLRKEKIKNIWKKYYIYIIIFLVIIIFAPLSYQITKTINLSKNEKYVEDYLNYINISDSNNKIIELENLSRNNNNLISSLASLKIANIYIEENKIKEGRSELLKISNDINNNEIIRDLALYFYLMSGIDTISSEKIFSLLPNEKIQRSAYKFLFQELMAIHFIILNDLDKANQYLSKLSNDIDTPFEIKSRVEKFIKFID